MGDNPFRASRVNPFANDFSFDGSTSSHLNPNSNEFSARPSGTRSSFHGADSPALSEEGDDHLDPLNEHEQHGSSANNNAYPLTSYPPVAGSRDGSYTTPNRLTTDSKRDAGSVAGSHSGSYMSNPAAGRKAYNQSVRSGRTNADGRSFVSQRSSNTQSNRKAFVSTRLKGEIYKPWLEHPDPAQKWARWITIGAMVLGVAAAGILSWDGYRSTPNIGKLCMVMEDKFTGTELDSSKWQHDIQIGGFGNGEFDWTTSDKANSFVDNGVLYIVPTLTTDVLDSAQIINGYNLTLDDCTASNKTGPMCTMMSNSTTGKILPPVRSARITTQNSHSIRYGKVQFEAKMPTGDWIWPTVRMMPVEDFYGPFPISGEIDILMGRGNGATYPFRGLNYISSMLHWGPSIAYDRYYWTWGWTEQRRSYYNAAFHTYGIEWTDKYLWTYIDSRVNQVVSLDFKKKNFFKRGMFPKVVANGTDEITLVNPWLRSDNNSAPFDRAFYLSLNVAVGGTSGWFPDGVGEKPWVDSASTAVADFYNATSKWSQTWPEDHKQRGMAVKNLKMWQSC